jgi:hypothetical protein
MMAAAMPRKPAAGAGESDPARYRREAKRLRPTGDAIIALGGREAFSYLAALGCVQYVAHHGVHRPRVMNEASESERAASLDPANRSGAAGTKKTSGEYATGLSKPIGESKPPNYDRAAMALLRAERKHLAQRERALLAKLDAILGEE